MNRALHGSCHVPVAAYARLDGAHLYLAGLVVRRRDRPLRARAMPAERRTPEALG